MSYILFLSASTQSFTYAVPFITIFIAAPLIIFNSIRARKRHEEQQRQEHQKRQAEMDLELERKRLQIEQEKAKLKQTPQIQICQYCKTESNSNSKFCENCGSRFFE